MHRRAAALFRHQREANREMSVEGIVAVLDEMDALDEFDGWDPEGEMPWIGLVCALLNVGCEMAKAARDDAENEYLDDVIRAASVAELGTEDD